MPISNPNPDKGSIEGFESGVWAKSGEFGKVMQDKGDTFVQSTHYHRHSGGATLTVHYRDGRTEAYNLETGEQQKDKNYSK